MTYYLINLVEEHFRTLLYKYVYSILELHFSIRHLLSSRIYSFGQSGDGVVIKYMYIYTVF